MQRDIERRAARVPPGLTQFQRRLQAVTPHVFVTRMIVGVNVAIFVAMVLSGASLMGPEPATMIAWGGNFKPLTTGGEPWRLFTCMFLHYGLLHIGFNMWVLWQVGGLGERLFGNSGFALLYVLAGLGGSLASTLFGRAGAVSAGASGAIFGVFGALLAYLLLQRKSFPVMVLRSLRSSTLTFIGYNVLFGFMVGFIDNAAHLGGLATGFVAGAVLAQPLTVDASQLRWQRNLLLLGLGIIAGWQGLDLLQGESPPWPSA